MKRDIIIIEDKAVSVTGNDVWMTATEIAGLFHTTVPAVNAAIKAVRKSDVLNDYEVCRYMQLENRLYADVYALEIIIPVAFRLNTYNTHLFRTWLYLSDVLETLTPNRKKVAYAAIELYKRLKEGQIERPALLDSNNVYKVMYPVLCDISTEEVWVLLLNSSSKLIRKVRISCGGLNTALVDVRVAMRQILYYNAVSFIMVHNHPSGIRKPSSADNRLTEAVKKAAETLDIRLVDHVIVAGNNYYSYADEGKL